MEPEPSGGEEEWRRRGVEEKRSGGEEEWRGRGALQFLSSFSHQLLSSASSLSSFSPELLISSALEL
jgi:hypothetical protein